MATDLPQRELRNNTAELLRRVERGERLRITVHGHPIAELVPIERSAVFVASDQLVRDLGGVLDADDPLARELREGDSGVRDPFE